MAGTFVPDVYPGGNVTNPSTRVPSALVAVKRSTLPSVMPVRNVVVHGRDARQARCRRGRHVVTRETSGGWVTELLEHDDLAGGTEVEAPSISRSPCTRRSGTPPAAGTRSRGCVPPSSSRT